MNIPTLPVYEWLPDQLKLANNVIGLLHKRSIQYEGLFNMYLGPNKVCVTTRADFCKHILQKNNKNYRKSPFVQPLREAIGNGLLTSEGPYWLQQRRLIQPNFHRKRLQELCVIMQEQIETYSDNLLTQIKENKDLNIVPEMMKLTMKVVARSLFSTGFSEEEVYAVGQHIDKIQMHVMQEIRFPYLKKVKEWTGKERAFREELYALDKILYRTIDQRKKIPSADRPSDLLTMLLEAKYADTGEGMIRSQLREESLILFTAGHETSALALSWTFYLLAKHPDKLAILQEELASVLEDRIATFEDLPKLVYTKQVIEEAMRLYPPAWIIDRVALEEDEVDGYKIPKDHIVNVFVYGLHRNPAYFEQPETFMPERFAPEKKKQMTPYSYAPFGGGPRMCIGNNFALYEMQLTLAHLLRKFRFKLVPNQNVIVEALVTLRPKGGIRFEVEAI